MKREIKFRGRNYDGMWMYGYLMPAPKPTIHLDCDYSISVSPSALKSVDRMLYEVETNTIGQYTGLKDKNGREIYEGDIVEWLFFYTVHSSNGADGDREELLMGVIEWRQGGFVFRILENDFENAGWYSISDLHTETQTDVEVIGNIYENPELLEK